MPAKKTVKGGTSKDILQEFNEFKKTLTNLDKSKPKNSKTKKLVKSPEKIEPVENLIGSISIIVNADLKKKVEKELKRLSEKNKRTDCEETLNSEEDFITKDPKDMSSNIVNLEEIINSKKDYSTDEDEFSEQDAEETDEEETDDKEDENIIKCDECKISIVRDSREHDNMICDTEGILWFCLDCLENKQELMKKHKIVLTGYEEQTQEETIHEETTQEETTQENSENEEPEDMEIDTEQIFLKGGIEVCLNLQNNVLYQENDEGEYDIIGKAKETKGKKYDFICQNKKYLIV